LAGYHVYRRWGNPEYVRIAGTRLSPAPLATPSFTDTTLDPKGKFYYVVEAVDRRGVASDKSSAVEVEMK
jgi:fibronectin type 3 domain-containing protein